MASIPTQPAGERCRPRRAARALLLALAGVLWAGGAAERAVDARTALDCAIPTSTLAHDAADRSYGDAPSLDGGSARRSPGPALDTSLPKVQLTGTPSDAAAGPAPADRFASLEPARGTGAARATYLLTRRLRI